MQLEGKIDVKRGVAYFTMPLRLVSFPLFTPLIGNSGLQSLELPC